MTKNTPATPPLKITGVGKFTPPPKPEPPADKPDLEEN